jgi:apolipoprotein N-acyltransferase
MMSQTGFVGALPHLLMTVIVPLGGLLADHVRKKGILTTTNVRKVFNCGGFGMEALFFLVVAYAQSAVTATAALTMGVAFSGFAISGIVSASILNLKETNDGYEILCTQFIMYISLCIGFKVLKSVPVKNTQFDELQCGVVQN